MKKLLSVILASTVAIGTVVAQNNEQKVYLPEAGDWAIGVDVKPLLNFAGNIFNGSVDNSLESFGGGEPTLGSSMLMNAPTASLMGKYMLTDNLAIKANLGILIHNSKNAAYVRDDAAYRTDPLSDAMVADVRNTRNTGISFLAGAEYRVGKNRVQGVFGGGLLIGVQNSVTTYRYGNEMTEVNQQPSSVFSNGAYRTLKTYSGDPAVITGLVGSAGVEWFVAPKIALGAEVSLAMAYTFNRQQYSLSEGYNPALRIVEEKTDLEVPATAEFTMGTSNLGGSLYLSFYF